jgi:hypothetical protein
MADHVLTLSVVVVLFLGGADAALNSSCQSTLMWPLRKDDQLSSD